MLRRTTDDDSTTERKVNLLLERINKLKWRTSKNVEEEEKVSVGMMCLPVLIVLIPLETPIPLFIHVGLCSRGEADAGETDIAGERSVRVKAKTGNRNEGAVPSHPADSPTKPVTSLFL